MEFGGAIRRTQQDGNTSSGVRAWLPSPARSAIPQVTYEEHDFDPMAFGNSNEQTAISPLEEQSEICWTGSTTKTDDLLFRDSDFSTQIDPMEPQSEMFDLKEVMAGYQQRQYQEDTDPWSSAIGQQSMSAYQSVGLHSMEPILWKEEDGAQHFRPPLAQIPRNMEPMIFQTQSYDIPFPPLLYQQSEPRGHSHGRAHPSSQLGIPQASRTTSQSKVKRSTKVSAPKEEDTDKHDFRQPHLRISTKRKPRIAGNGKVADTTSLHLTHPEVLEEWAIQGMSVMEIEALIRYYRELSRVFGPVLVHDVLQARHTMNIHRHDHRIKFAASDGMPTAFYDFGPLPKADTSKKQVQPPYVPNDSKFQLVYWPRQWEFVPPNITLEEICDKYPNHMRHEDMDAFIQQNVSPGVMWDELPGCARKTIAKSGNAKCTNVMTKRRQRRLNLLDRTYGTERLIKFLESPYKLRLAGDIKTRKWSDKNLPQKYNGAEDLYQISVADLWEAQGKVDGVARRHTGSKPVTEAMRPKPTPVAGPVRRDASSTHQVHQHLRPSSQQPLRPNIHDIVAGRKPMLPVMIKILPDPGELDQRSQVPCGKSDGLDTAWQGWQSQEMVEGIELAVAPTREYPKGRLGAFPFWPTTDTPGEFVADVNSHCEDIVTMAKTLARNVARTGGKSQNDAAQRLDDVLRDVLGKLTDNASIHMHMFANPDDFDEYVVFDALQSQIRILLRSDKIDSFAHTVEAQRFQVKVRKSIIRPLADVAQLLGAGILKLLLASAGSHIIDDMCSTNMIATAKRNAASLRSFITKEKTRKHFVAFESPLQNAIAWELQLMAMSTVQPGSEAFFSACKNMTVGLRERFINKAGCLEFGTQIQGQTAFADVLESFDARMKAIQNAKLLDEAPTRIAKRRRDTEDDGDSELDHSKQSSKRYRSDDGRDCQTPLKALPRDNSVLENHVGRSAGSGSQRAPTLKTMPTSLPSKHAPRDELRHLLQSQSVFVGAVEAENVVPKSGYPAVDVDGPSHSESPSQILLQPHETPAAGTDAAEPKDTSDFSPDRTSKQIHASTFISQDQKTSSQHKRQKRRRADDSDDDSEDEWRPEKQQRQIQRTRRPTKDNDDDNGAESGQVQHKQHSNRPRSGRLAGASKTSKDRETAPKRRVKQAQRVSGWQQAPSGELEGFGWLDEEWMDPKWMENFEDFRHELLPLPSHPYGIPEEEGLEGDKGGDKNHKTTSIGIDDSNVSSSGQVRQLETEEPPALDDYTADKWDFLARRKY